LAREGGVSFNEQGVWHALFASKPAPTIAALPATKSGGLSFEEVIHRPDEQVPLVQSLPACPEQRQR
ncbi:hypothetical protein, partial [Pseudomonas sp. PS01299]|uniref:hypothetical protein n=1 Tax=Pseudomonas sp. PS01299 TaxID=2991435 RepID=UPI00249C7F29